MDEDYEISLEGMRGPDERATIIATRELTDEKGGKPKEGSSLRI